ncbi:MAG: response regulator transcription factor [Betaproteobacteria bacterium]|nr:response regulator transcription factor [Betaproteobacteria bacterium]
MRILIVEDDTMLAEAIASALRQSAHVVTRAASGDEAERLLVPDAFDLVLLDLGLPRVDGFEVLRRMRERRVKVPVLVLTARDAPGDRVAGLDLGADDYLTKPFQLPELEARVRALIRRAHAIASSEIVHGPLKLDMAGRRLYCRGEPVELSARELAVVELFMLREGRVVTKQQIADHLYGWEEGSSSNTIEVFVYRLRRKLEPSGVDIRTVRGMGYLIDRPAA